LLWPSHNSSPSLRAQRSNPEARGWGLWIASPAARNDGVDGSCSNGIDVPEWSLL
jgi:hypothetical protein